MSAEPQPCDGLSYNIRSDILLWYFKHGAGCPDFCGTVAECMCVWGGFEHRGYYGSSVRLDKCLPTGSLMKGRPVETPSPSPPPASKPCDSRTGTWATHQWARHGQKINTVIRHLAGLIRDRHVGAYAWLRLEWEGRGRRSSSAFSDQNTVVALGSKCGGQI